MEGFICLLIEKNLGVFLLACTMNHSAPDWNVEPDLPISNHIKPMGQDNELVELLWENGQVVLNSQTHRKQVQRNDQPTLREGSLSYGNSSNLIHDYETVSWIQYPIEDSFEKEFCSDFFSELPLSDPMEAENINNNDPSRQPDYHQTTAIPNQLNLSSSPPEFCGNPMPPPIFQFDSAHNKKNLRGLSKSKSGNSIRREAEECSAMTVGSSYCGSNQVLNDIDFSRGSSNGFGTTVTSLSVETLKDGAQKDVVQSEKGKIETVEHTVTSSSGGSGFTSCHKRKGRDGEDYGSQSEAAEHQSAAANKPPQQSGLSRRSRAAEIHNLSERRRRDRINEKMRALKELIPHCNKTDKASMLDEAIEYLKSLQLQLQLMWMGNGMAPMMFPGIQHYMSRMGMGIGPSAMPSIHNPLQAATGQTQHLNPINYQHHVQNPTLSDQYARFLGFHQMQNASQQVNMFGYGPQTTTQSPMALAPTGTIRPTTTNNTSPSGKMG